MSMSDIVSEKRGRAGIITLSRPKALNALDTPMCLMIRQALLNFAADEDIAHIVLRSFENGRFFCAGGDIRALYQQMRQGVYEGAVEFFRTDYRLTQII